jgi:hypothetical protein
MTILNQAGAPVSSKPVKITWTAILPALVETAAKAPQPAAREFAMGQLLLLAGIVDQHIEHLEGLRDAVEGTRSASANTGASDPCPDCGIRGSHTSGCPLAAPGAVACSGCGNVGHCTCEGGNASSLAGHGADWGNLDDVDPSQALKLDDSPAQGDACGTDDDGSPRPYRRD